MSAETSFTIYAGSETKCGQQIVEIEELNDRESFRTRILGGRACYAWGKVTGWRLKRARLALAEEILEREVGRNAAMRCADEFAESVLGNLPSHWTIWGFQVSRWAARAMAANRGEK